MTKSLGTTPRVLSSALVLSLLTSNASAEDCTPRFLGADRRGPSAALARDGNILFLGTGAAIQVFDVAVPSRPRSLGYLNLDDVVLELERVSKTLVARGRKGLDFVDVSDPASPTRIGRFAFPDQWTGTALSLSGSIAFVSANTNGLRVVDFSNPDAAVEIAVHPMAWISDLLVRGDRLFVTGAGGLSVFDVSVPSSPERTTLLPATFGALALSSLAVRLVAAWSECDRGYCVGRLRVLDVSDPDHPESIGSLEYGEKLSEVAVGGGLIFVAEGTGLVSLFELAGAGPPRRLGELQVDSPRDLESHGEFLHVADGSGGLRIFSVSDPNAPPEVARVAIRGSTRSGVLRNDVATTAHDVGLRVFDLSDPTSPALLGIAETEAGDGHDMTLSGDHAFLATAQDGIQILRLSDPESPGPIASFGPTFPAAIASNVELLFSAPSLDGDGVDIFDLSDRESPFRLSRILPDDWILDLAAAGSLLFAWKGFLVHELIIVDISDPASPVELARIPDLYELESVARDEVLYFTDETGFSILDVSDASAPTLAGRFEAGSRGRSIDAYGELVAVGTRDSHRQDAWVRLVDVRNPDAPVERLAYDLPGSADRVLLGPGIAVVADGEAGISVFETCVPFVDGFESGDLSTWSRVATN